MIVKDLRNSFNPVPKDINKTKEKKTEIKKKSSKLAKLERKRDKGIVKEGICEVCGKFSKRLDPHEIYGGSNRQRSIKHKFVKLMCRECHHNNDLLKQLKIDTQKKFEQEKTREEFIKIVGKSYIKEE